MDVKKEYVVVYHGQHGTVKVAYRNAESMAVDLINQTAGGWVAQHVYQRNRTLPED